MRKRIFVSILAALLLFGTLAVTAGATETEPTEAYIGGKFGEGFTWRLEDGVLTISGEGEMEHVSPWADYADSIRKVVFTNGVTTVGGAAFQGYESIKEVDFGNTMTEIGVNAFRNCTGLTELHLPESFRRFHESCFEGCTSLGKVYFDGYMPNFRSNCLWNGGKMNLYFNPDHRWRVEHILELEENFGGRLEVLCTDGTDPLEYRPGSGEFTVPTEPEETVPPTTVPETVPPTTQAPTEPPVTTVPPATVPETTVEETTVPETTQEETTLPETQPTPIQPAQPPRKSNSYIGLILIAGVLAFFVVGGVLFGTRKGGKYKR